jgi:tRNA (adenine22-N1)-methyltransferase
LENSEVDVVVMAGIGGNLMQEILEYDMDKSLSFSKYILQPRRHPGMIRYFLLNNGFRIKEENLVEEGKFICEIITAVPAGHVERKAPAAGPGSDEHDDITDPGCALAMDERMEHAAPDSIVWEVPPWYGRSDEALAVQYVVRKLKREEMILKSKEDSKKADLSVTKNNIMYLKSVIEELKRNCK